jgi:lysyl-tRNA synthetase class 2
MNPKAQQPSAFPASAWAPSASLETLRARAALMQRVRAFFATRGVLEVETPTLSAHATVDRHIESFHTADGRWLHTSPEFAMKRLLAAGAGDIWQSCKVFRREEAGRHHNPEFTMLEWYRVGFDHHRLMDEVEALLLTCGVSAPRFDRLSYREAFLKHAGFDPFATALEVVTARATAHSPPPADGLAEQLDAWLDYFFGAVVSPALGHAAPCFVYDFPASQAALARVRGEVAERFELIWRGVELANGFHELADAAEQTRRFAGEQAARREAGQVVPPGDRHLIAALAAGLPDCAGVALGLDRLLMLLLELPDLASTLAFETGRA